MAMNGDNLGQDISDNLATAMDLETLFPGFDRTQLDKWAKSIGNTVVNYLKANMELDAASLDSDAVTGTDNDTPPNDMTGSVTDGAVSGGVK